MSCLLFLHTWFFFCLSFWFLWRPSVKASETCKSPLWSCSTHTVMSHSGKYMTVIRLPSFDGLWMKQCLTELHWAACVQHSCRNNNNNTKKKKSLNCIQITIKLRGQLIFFLPLYTLCLINHSWLQQLGKKSFSTKPTLNIKSFFFPFFIHSSTRRSFSHVRASVQPI